MDNIFYKPKANAFLILSQILKKERLTYNELQAILFSLKTRLKNNQIPKNQIQEMLDVGLIEEMTQQEINELRK